MVPPLALPSVVANLSAKGKLERLQKLFRGRARALVLTHDNPDPDSMASAWGLATVLQERMGVPTEMGYGGIIGRAENSAFVDTLKLPIKKIEELDLATFDVFALVDTQQAIGNHALPASCCADIVIDHHPLREGQLNNPYADLGGAYGATSTMITEYLRAASITPSPQLATALYYGIKADTRDLGRQTTDPDVECYLWLFPQIDRALLSQIEHPKLPVRYFQLYHAAIEKARLHSQAVITDMGEVYSPDLVPEVAERMSFIENVKWSLALGSYRSQLYLSLRVGDKRMNAGRLVREICGALGGSAGGHGSMAGARLPLTGKKAQRDTFRRELVRKFKEAFGVEKERGLSLLSDDA